MVHVKTTIEQDISSVDNGCSSEESEAKNMGFGLCNCSHIARYVGYFDVLCCMTCIFSQSYLIFFHLNRSCELSKLRKALKSDGVLTECPQCTEENNSLEQQNSLDMELEYDESLWMW